MTKGFLIWFQISSLHGESDALFWVVSSNCACSCRSYTFTSICILVQVLTVLGQGREGMQVASCLFCTSLKFAAVCISTQLSLKAEQPQGPPWPLPWMECNGTQGIWSLVLDRELEEVLRYLLLLIIFFFFWKIWNKLFWGRQFASEVVVLLLMCCKRAGAFNAELSPTHTGTITHTSMHKTAAPGRLYLNWQWIKTYA